MSDKARNSRPYLYFVERMVASQESARPGQAFLSALADLNSEAEDRIASRNHKLFGEAALIRFVTQELIRFTIEDEGIDVRDEASRVADAFVRYFDTADMAALWDAYESVVKKKPIEVRRVLLRAPDHGIGIYASMPVDPKQLIPVSTSMYPIVPVLEDSISDPQVCADLVSVYSKLINQVKSDSGIDRLCFIEKAVGPVGALGLLSSLVQQTGVPACVYRQRYFADRGRISGNCPVAGQSMVLIYDLVVSGHALKQAAANLERVFGVTVIGAVVLLNYGKRTFLKSKKPFKIHSIISYSTIKDDAERVYSGMIECTETVYLLSRVRDRFASSAHIERDLRKNHGGIADMKAKDALGLMQLEQERIKRGWKGEGLVPAGMSLEEFVKDSGLTEDDLSPHLKTMLSDPEAARDNLKAIGILPRAEKRPSKRLDKSD